MKLSAFTLILTLALSAFAADASWVGTWKLNPEKSQIAGDETTISSLPSGEYRWEDSSGMAFSFRLDGKESPVPGGMISFHTSSPDVWEFAIHRQDAGSSTSGRITVHGDSLTSAYTDHLPGGQERTTTSISRRLSGGPGIVGVWQDTEVKIPVTTIQLTASGTDGLTYQVINDRTTCSARFDGAPCAIVQNGVTIKEATWGFRRSGSAGIERTILVGGKTISVETFTASADGKVLTVEGTAGKERQKLIYERQ